MDGLRDGERPRKQPFWSIDDFSEAEVVSRVLERRFPGTFDILESSLEEADPLDIVYPDNPSEYSDVVLEIVVLLAPENADLARVDRHRVTEVVEEGLARRFGEEPDTTRVARAVELIIQRATNHPT